MQINSVIVGVQHYDGVECLEKGSEVVLCFDEENRYSENTIVVKNENGDVVGNIISKLNHPSVSEEAIVLNNIKNDKMIRKTTTSNCKATIKRITKYVIFIVVDTENIVEVNEIEALQSEIIKLNAMVLELSNEVKALKASIIEEDTSPERMLLSVVGLSHFQGQHHMGGNLSIVEEPIFEGAKGTALYLKSGNYRVGVFPSEKKKKYCEEHKIPYYENKLLKNKEFGSDIRIEELVYDEYAIISV